MIVTVSPSRERVCKGSKCGSNCGARDKEFNIALSNFTVFREGVGSSFCRAAWIGVG